MYWDSRRNGYHPTIHSHQKVKSSMDAEDEYHYNKHYLVLHYQHYLRVKIGVYVNRGALCSAHTKIWSKFMQNWNPVYLFYSPFFQPKKYKIANMQRLCVSRYGRWHQPMLTLAVEVNEVICEYLYEDLNTAVVDCKLKPWQCGV